MIHIGCDVIFSRTRLGSMLRVARSGPSPRKLLQDWVESLTSGGIDHEEPFHGRADHAWRRRTVPWATSHGPNTRSPRSTQQRGGALRYMAGPRRARLLHRALWAHIAPGFCQSLDNTRGSDQDRGTERHRSCYLFHLPGQCELLGWLNAGPQYTH
jgi:hypothetical protein